MVAATGLHIDWEILSGSKSYTQATIKNTIKPRYAWPFYSAIL